MDTQFDLGEYVPSINNNNSRAGSMKKLTRKTDKSPATSKKSAKQNDLDQLDDLLNDDIMPSKKRDSSLGPPKKSATNSKLNDNTFDSFFDEPSTNLNLDSKVTTKTKDNNISKSPSKMDFARTSIAPMIDETDSFVPNFSKNDGGVRDRSKSPTTNYIKVPDDPIEPCSASMRNMRPPLKRKDSAKFSAAGNQSTFGLSLYDDEKKENSFLSKPAGERERGKGTETLTLNILDADDSFKPSKSMNMGGRRASVDRNEKKYENNQTGLTLPGEDNYNNRSSAALVSNFNLPDKSQKSNLHLNGDSPKRQRSPINQMKIGESIMINQKNSQFYNSRMNDHKSSFKSIDINKKDSQYSFDKPSSSLVNNHNSDYRLNSPPKLNPGQRLDESSRNGFQDYEKQITNVKRNYQKQLDFLQESLDKQIRVNQQTRDRLMRQANSMIDQERKRGQRMHQEQVKRMKDINEWEKKKIEDSYKFEVQSLKTSLAEYAKVKQKNVSINSQQENKAMQDTHTSQKYKRQIQRLQEQLNSQKKLLVEKEHFLTKRQLDLEERQSNFNQKRRKQDERFRNQEKSLMQKEMGIKNQILNEKRSVGDEKTKIAMEAATMELQLIKKKEKLDLLIKEVEMEKDAINSQRCEVRNMNQQLMSRYKEKMDQLSSEKQRVDNLEAELIRKLRIIEIKARQSNIPLTETFKQQNFITKENNWLRTQQRPHSTSGVDKKAKMKDTFQRYNKVEKSVNQTISHINQVSKTSGPNVFRLEDYMVSINKQSRTRLNNFM